MPFPVVSFSPLLAQNASPDTDFNLLPTMLLVALLVAVASVVWVRWLNMRLRAKTDELGTLNANLQHAQKLAQIGFFTFDPATGKSTWAEETYRIYRFPATAEAPRAKDFMRIVHPEDRAQLDSKTRGAAEQGGMHAFLFRIQFGEEIRWIRASFEVRSSTAHPRPVLVGAVQDVTEHQNAAERIQALNQTLEERVEERTAELEEVRERLSIAEQRWSFALDGSGEGVWDWTLPTNAVFFSRRWKEMLGFAKDELEHSYQAWSNLVHPDDLPAVVAAVQAYIDGTSPAYDVIYRMRHKDGHYAWIEDRGKIMERAQDGRVLRLVGTHTDVTARVEAEQQLQAQTKQLDATNRELEAFCYSVSHDLRTPLRSIDGFSQALLEDYHDRLDEDGRDYLRRVRAATQRMGRLIDDLLSLSRVSRGEVRRSQVNLSAQAAVILAELRAQQPQRNVEAKIAPDVTVEADPALMDVVLMNLLGNAWKYSGRQAAARIELGAHTSAVGEPTIYVRDNGAGFEMAYADKLFSVFQRLHSNDEFEGNGVGLATVQRIVHRHGGRVWAESEVGCGATFSFTIPPAASQLSHPHVHG